MKTKWEIRQIDALLYDGMWIWNDSIAVGSFQTEGDPAPAFVSALCALGVLLAPEEADIEDDDYVIELCAPDGRLLYAALEVA